MIGGHRRKNENWSSKNKKQREQSWNDPCGMFELVREDMMYLSKILLVWVVDFQIVTTKM